MELEEQAKYFMGKYFLKEFLYVKAELFNEPVRIENYISEVIKKINGKNIDEILDDIFESGSRFDITYTEGPDLANFLNKYIKLYQKNKGNYPSVTEILRITENTYELVNAFIYEVGHKITINNGISTEDTIAEYDFGKMLYEELKDSEMTGFFVYEFEDLKKRLGL